MLLIKVVVLIMFLMVMVMNGSNYAADFDGGYNDGLILIMAMPKTADVCT